MSSLLVTTRAANGSPLTNTQMDTNLTNLLGGFDNIYDMTQRITAFDSAATLNQVATTIRRGVTVNAAASSGAQFFRNALVQSTSLTDVATFTRATSRYATDQSGTLASFASGVPAQNTAGLHVHQASTNLLLQSNTFNVTWGIENATITAASTTGPDGTNNGWKLAEITGAAATHDVSQQVTKAASAITYTATIYAKAAERSWLNLQTSDGVANGVRFFFNLATGAIGSTVSIGTPFTNLTSSATVVGNGWVRCSITFTTNTATVVEVRPMVATADATYSYAGVTGSGIYLADAQLEQLGFATPYISTTTGTANRNADVVQETVNIPVGQAFSVVGTCAAPITSAWSSSPTIFHLTDGSAGPANDLQLAFNAAGLCVNTDSHSLFATASVAETLLAGQLIGFAIAVNGNTVTYSFNGSAAQTLTLAGGAFSAALTSLFLGCNKSSTNQLNSTIRDFRILGRALSGTECATFSDVSLEWDLDFTTQTYKFGGDTYASLTDLPLTTFSRAAPAYEVTIAGYLLNVATGVVRAIDAGLTVEAAATNVIFPSIVKSSGNGSGTWNTTNGWNGHAITVTSNDTTVLAPDGTTTAAKVAIPAATVDGPYFRTTTVPSANEVWTGAVWLYSTTGETFQVSFSASGGTAWTSAPVTNKTLTPNTWTRVTCTATAASTVTATSVTIVALSQTAGTTYWQWNSNVERTAYATTDIVTTTATATRPADVLLTTDASPSALSVMAKFTIPSSGPTTVPVWQWDDGSNANIVRAIYDTGHLYFQVYSGGANQCNLDLGAVTRGNTYKLAAAVQANDAAASLNGATCVTKAVSVTMPVNATQFRYGMDAGGIAWGSGIQQIKRWRSRRSNATLQADAT